MNKELDSEKILAIQDALDNLALRLTDYNHKWSDEDRFAYNKATLYLQEALGERYLSDFQRDAKAVEALYKKGYLTKEQMKDAVFMPCRFNKVN